MRDKGGSDLDVFNSLTKGGGSRGPVAASGAAASEVVAAAPPPPPSLRDPRYDEPLASAEEVSVDEELDDAPQLEVSELADIEEVDAIGEDEFGFRADETTNVFSLPQSAAAPAPGENAYQYSEPAWSPAAPPYSPPAHVFAPPVAFASGLSSPIASPLPISGLPPTPLYSPSPLPSLGGGLPVPPPPASLPPRPNTSAPPPPPPAAPQSCSAAGDPED